MAETPSQTTAALDSLKSLGSDFVNTRTMTTALTHGKLQH